jgi:hypothetical protein
MGVRTVSLSDEDISYLKSLLVSRPDKYSISKKIIQKFDRSQQRITVASAKSKGREFQYYIGRKIAALLGVSFGTDDEALVSSRPMGQHGIDIILRGEAGKRFPFSVECKAAKELRIADAVKQAEANKAPGKMAMVAFRQTGGEPVVIFSWDTFEALFKLIS